MKAVLLSSKSNIELNSEEIGALNFLFVRIFLRRIHIIKIVERLILYRFSLYGNGRLKRFVNCCYGIFQQLYFTNLYQIVTANFYCKVRSAVKH
ncbi:hypothetical protein AR546_08425 [Leptospira interrogans serovar Canicola]|nr:hypothetical protein B2G47_03140 [Leptospira interrogans serovar Canicola]ASV08867.1 hypothetical protein B2G50_08245 [Leptospira interrogans serovar Canicola]OLZ31774.1 hypothetical protein AR546_08425 [Leptospira interrogans serovar Canicola]OMH69098.1 hypothetical protein BW243_04860 [Leptospira interrogans serovar Pomona]POR17468.1 hypothetical protein B0T34_15110 [Leptospira interrogans serovar Canicola]